MVGYKNDCLMPGKGFYISSARPYQNQTGIYAEDIPKIRKVVKRTDWKPFLKKIENYSASK